MVSSRADYPSMGSVDIPVPTKLELCYATPTPTPYYRLYSGSSTCSSDRCPGRVDFPLYPRDSTGKSIPVLTPSPKDAYISRYFVKALSSILRASL